MILSIFLVESGQIEVLKTETDNDVLQYLLQFFKMKQTRRIQLIKEKITC
jgi:hypothetical protein